MPGSRSIAHGEFTDHPRADRLRERRHPQPDRTTSSRSPGLYVLATATIGVVLMKESKRIGRRLFPRLDWEERRCRSS